MGYNFTGGITIERLCVRLKIIQEVEMKKLNVFLICIALVIITASATYVLTANGVFGAPIFGANAAVDTTPAAGNAKVMITKQQLDEYKALEEKYADLEELQEYIKANYYKEVDPAVLLEGATKGIFNALGDPYSLFMNKTEFKSFEESLTGEFPGIGVYIAPNPDRGIEVVSPIEDTPAQKAGIRALDIIKAVNGVEYSHTELDAATKVIRGEPGTNVTVTIYRPSTNETFDLTITRAVIVIKSVKSEMLSGNIGYIRITQFDNSVADEFYEHLTALVDKGAVGIVLDLRDNPGGSLSQCLDISDMLLPKAVICTTKGRAPNSTDEFTSDQNYYDGPLVLLVNEGSASASEIVSGAVKDNKRGVLIGTKTFGKGIVQSVVPYKDGTGLKLTTSEYFTPSGVNIHGVGIEPDIVLPLSDEYKATKNPTNEQDNQLQKAIEVINKQLGR